MRRELLTILLAASFAAPAVAQEQTTSGSEVTSDTSQEGGPIVVTGQKPKKDKKVCRRSVATGSIMPTTTCRTVGEWEEVTERSVATLERLRADQRTRDHIQEMKRAAGGK